jgi:glycosyltransferase involved in cell wall biosynthesis
MGTALGFPFVINKLKTDLLRLSKYAKKIVVLADWYKVILEKNGVSSSKLIYIKQGMAADLQIAGNNTKISIPLKLVYIGRISALKGLHLLIEAVQQISTDKISLDIYGPEEEEEYAMKCRQKSKENRNIRWNGTIHSEIVIQTLSKYDVLCLPSAFEMSPLVIQEAFAAGLPVLASDVYGNAEQITHGVNGWLFKLNDAMDLAVKLEELVSDLDSVVKAKPYLHSINTFRDVAFEHKSIYSAILSSQN